MNSVLQYFIVITQGSKVDTLDFLWKNCQKKENQWNCWPFDEDSINKSFNFWERVEEKDDVAKVPCDYYFWKEINLIWTFPIIIKSSYKWVQSSQLSLKSPLELDR